MLPNHIAFCIMTVSNNNRDFTNSCHQRIHRHTCTILMNMNNSILIICYYFPKCTHIRKRISGAGWKPKDPTTHTKNFIIVSFRFLRTRDKIKLYFCPINISIVIHYNSLNTSVTQRTNYLKHSCHGHSPRYLYSPSLLLNQIHFIPSFSGAMKSFFVLSPI